MERIRVAAMVMAFGLAAMAVQAQDKKDGAGGPYGLPTLDQVKEKCKPTDEETKKLEEIYKEAAKNEAETKSRAKENGTDRKQLEQYLSIGRSETINKIKDAMDKDKGKTFDQLCSGSQPSKKKK